MYITDNLEVWNLTPDIPVLVGAQKYFNIVGHLKNPSQVLNFYYSLNSGSEKLVYFNDLRKSSGRLQNYGDFNIDTVTINDLKPTNQLILILKFTCQPEYKKYYINFPCLFHTEHSPKFHLNLERVKYPQQIGQVIDGKWYISHDETGRACLEIRKEDAGHDRIILMGSYNWTHSYEISAKLCVTRWTQPVHNVGLLFKWNPHLIGDGTSLPTQWSTGLGYYYSKFPGLRIRFGVNVYVDSQGKKQGDYILKKGILSPCRYVQGRVLKLLRRCMKVLNLTFLVKEKNLPFSEIVPGTPYCFCMRVDPEEYSLTVWKEHQPQPSPQLIVRKPLDRLPQGSAGIIAYNCGLRVYEFNVSPIQKTALN